MPLYLRKYLSLCLLLVCSLHSSAQTSTGLKFNNSAVYAGIEVGSKGVKMSILELGKNAKKNGAFNLIKDTSVNTDFINFSSASYQATLKGLCQLYKMAMDQYNLPATHVFTVVSSGVKIQAEKDDKTSWINSLADSFKLKINDPARKLSVVDVMEEARLSHLGIIPDSKRYTTFLIDIGSGNTKGGYFPNGNTKDIRLFQLTWGTKSIANATDKRCEDDKSISNFHSQLTRVLSGPANTEITYAVNESGAYPMSDYIAFSGGIAWSVATLLYPDLIDNSIVPVSYEDVEKFSNKLYNNPSAFNEEAIVATITTPGVDKAAIMKEVKKVNQVFDQKALMAGTGLLLKIMRQFEGAATDKKQFYLIKNGQVGWISAYVDQNTAPN
jgi:hypothetical protein